MQTGPFVALASFLSLNIVGFNNCLTLACQEKVSLTFSKCRKDVPKAALISWVPCDSHFQTTFRSAGDILQVTFSKSIICFKLFKDLEINLLKMMSCKEDSIKALAFCIQAVCSLKSTTKNPQEFSICTQMKSKLNKNNFSKNNLYTAKHWVWI